MTDNHRYPAEVFWSEEDAGFIATASDLPGCSAFGETQQEALAELQDAITAWIEAAHSAGNPIPEPSDVAKKQTEYSGKVLLRMPRDLHARLARLAKIEAVSLNHYIVYLLTSASTHQAIEVSAYRSGQDFVTSHGQYNQGSILTVGSHALAPILAGTWPQSSNLPVNWQRGHTFNLVTNELMIVSTGGTSFGQHEPVGTGETLWREAQHG